LWLVSDYFDGKLKDEVYMLAGECGDDETGVCDFTESVWLNLRLFESLLKQHATHRVTSYVKKLKQIQLK
jgi:hypothetical protein